MAGGKKRRSRESVEATVEEEEKRQEPQAEEAEQSSGSDGSSEGDDSGENEEVDDRFVADDRFSAGSGAEAMEEDSVQSEEGSEEDDEAEAKAIEKQKRKMRRDAEKFRDREMRKGVIYLSRIPPHMKPEKIRHLLGQYGDVLRIFLQPESVERWTKRKKAGGNKKRCYVDGWVEFSDKRRARKIATALNGQKMGGNRRNWFHDDLWSMRYLPKFKWNNLTERIAHEKRTKDARVRTIMSHAKKESSLYMKQVDKSKMIRAMEEKKRKRSAQQSNEAGSAPSNKRKRSAAEEEEAMDKVKRTFRQHKAIAPGTESSAKQQARTSSILSKMLGMPDKKKRRTSE